MGIHWYVISSTTTNFEGISLVIHLPSLFSLLPLVQYYAEHGVLNVFIPLLKRNNPRTKQYDDVNSNCNANMWKYYVALFSVRRSLIWQIVLFFFLGKIVYLLIAFISVTALSGTTFVIHPLFAFLLGRWWKDPSWDFGFGSIIKMRLNHSHLFESLSSFNHLNTRVRYLGPVHLSGMLSFVTALSLVISWLVFKFWVLVDILAICIAITALTFVRIPNLTLGSVLLVLFFFYDIFWVFLSEFIFSKNVMVTVATNLPSLPMLIVIPRLDERGISILGVGDIVLPGILLSFLYRFDRSHGIPFKKGYFTLAWVGYVFGLIVTFFMVMILNRGQPALLYLVPSTLIPTVILGAVRKDLRTLFRPPAPIYSEEIPSNSDQETLLHEEKDLESVRSE